MLKNKLKRVFALIAVFILCFLCSFNTFGDLGDFNDYSNDSDWSSDNWDSNDWDSDNDVLYFGDNHHNNEYYDDDGFFIPVLVIVIIAVVIYSIFKNNGSGGSGNSSSNGSSNRISSGILKDNTSEITDAIIKYDPQFSSDKFIGWAKEVFFTLQLAWSARDFNAVRPFEKEELYNQHQMQIEQYKKNGRINVLERININNAYMYKYVRDNEYEYLTLFLNTRMIDYIKDEKTGQVLKGSPDKDCYPKYLYTFMRKTGVLTNPTVSNRSTTNCPNCGAPTQITSSGKCEYCDCVITTGEFDWVLSNIEGVKQNASVTEGGVFIKTDK